MTKLTLPQQLDAEGTLSFKLKPTENGVEKFYLIDFGESEERNRITLSIVKNGGTSRSLLLEIYNKEGVKESDTTPFAYAEVINLSFEIDLAWSSKDERIAVYVNDEQYINMKKPSIKFGLLGKDIHYGEDINGGNERGVEVEPASAVGTLDG